MNRMSPKRRGFSLLEIVIALFIFALGLIMIAAALPVSLQTIRESNDIAVSTFVVRTAAVRIQTHRERMNLSAADDELHWYDPVADAAPATPGAAATHWIRNEPGGWGVAVPYAGDERYAYQVFYRRGRMRASLEYDWEFHVVVQNRREERFESPVTQAELVPHPSGGMSAPRLATGDVWCDRRGVWRRYTGMVDADFRFGIPGGVMTYQSGLRF